MNLYKKYLLLHLKSTLQYKVSFILTFISQFFIFFTYYFVIVSLFDKFGNIKGFTVYEVLLTFSVIYFGYSVNEVFARGIDNFDKLIKTGKYDQLLLKPRSILLQVLGSDIEYTKISRLIQSLIVLIIALLNIKVKWNYLKIITLFLMLFSSIAIYFGLFLIAASYCFITIEGLEVRNVLTDGGKQVAQYPIGIFKKGFAFFFTFIIPYAFVNYYPLLYILGKSNNILFAFSPLLVVIFVIPCLYLFNLGSRKYISTGS